MKDSIFSHEAPSALEQSRFMHMIHSKLLQMTASGDNIHASLALGNVGPGEVQIDSLQRLLQAKAELI